MNVKLRKTIIRIVVIRKTLLVLWFNLIFKMYTIKYTPLQHCKLLSLSILYLYYYLLQKKEVNSS